jgi:Cu/Ag efflux pump CusA
MWIPVLGRQMPSPLIHRYAFSDIEVDAVAIRLPYPGAAPTEVEQTVSSCMAAAVEGEKLDKRYRRVLPRRYRA